MKKPSEKNVIKVYERLVADSFEGTRADLAAEIGIGLTILQDVINHVRSAEFVDENHWTIPYVHRGKPSNEWRVVNAEDLADQLYMRPSQDRRAEEMLETTRRNIAQSVLAKTTVDGRSREGRHWHRVLVSLQAAEAHLELLVDG